MFPYTHFSFLQHREPKTSDTDVGRPHFSMPDPAPILVVEFRDEVYAAIHAELSSRQVTVIRVSMSDAAVPVWRQRNPGLILVNAEMPDESGFLLSLKLRMHGYQGGLWLYSAHEVNASRGYQEFCQVDHLLNYGGDVRALMAHLNRFIQK